MKESKKDTGMVFGIILLVIIIIIKFNNKLYITNNTSYTNSTEHTITNKFQMVVKDDLPKIFKSGGTYSYEYVTIKSIKYKLEDKGWKKVIKTYWSGVAGPSYEGPNYSTKRGVGYKLYDPTGLVIKSGTFYTKSALKEKEIFKDDLEELSFYEEDFVKLIQPGTYTLELIDTN